MFLYLSQTVSQSASIYCVPWPYPRSSAHLVHLTSTELLALLLGLLQRQLLLLHAWQCPCPCFVFRVGGVGLSCSIQSLAGSCVWPHRMFLLIPASTSPTAAELHLMSIVVSCRRRPSLPSGGGTPSCSGEAFRDCFSLLSCKGRGFCICFSPEAKGLCLALEGLIHLPWWLRW